MSKLDAALAWAARGFRVFPLQVNGKRPFNDGWTDYATTDPEKIRALWTDQLTGAIGDFNIGTLTTNLVVLDVDAKPGKNGLDTFANLGCEFDTLTIRSASGGYHLYYKGFNASQSPLGRDLDVRSNNGYVLAPGSTIEGQTYQIEIEAPVAEVPPQIRARLKPPHERRQANPSVQIDTPEALALAEQYLDNDAPTAIEGQGGDDTTFRVACKLRDFGLSPGAAVEALALWNERCSPPWEPEALEAKVQNAFEYASGEAGGLHPAASFGQATILPAPPGALVDPIGEFYDIFQFGNVVRPQQFRPRPWVMGRLLMAKKVTALVAPGSAGKSTLALLVAAHLAIGQDLLGLKCHKPGKSIIYNAEDDREEMSQRLWAICAEYKFDFKEVSAKICILSSDDFDLQLTEGKATMNQKVVGALLKAAMDPEVVFLAIDPLVEVHNLNEDDNVDMKFVMSILRFLAQQANVAVFVAHHTRKPNSASAASFAGDANSGRGASSIINSARISLTLHTASRDDCTLYGLDEDERGMYVRLDDAKMNYALAADRPQWLKRIGVKVYNGDEVGVLVPFDAQENRRGARIVMARVLHAEMTSRAKASVSIPEAAECLKAGDQLYDKLPMTALKSRIETYLSGGVELDTGGKLTLSIVSGKKLIVIE